MRILKQLVNSNDISNVQFEKHGKRACFNVCRFISKINIEGAVIKNFHIIHITFTLPLRS